MEMGVKAVSKPHAPTERLQSIDGPLGNDTITFSYDELGRVSSQAINGGRIKGVS